MSYISTQVNHNGHISTQVDHNLQIVSQENTNESSSTNLGMQILKTAGDIISSRENTMSSNLCRRFLIKPISLLSGKCVKDKILINQKEEPNFGIKVLTTAGDLISGKLVADTLVGSDVCKNLIINPLKERAGKYAEEKILSYQEEETLQNLLKGGIDSILTDQRIEEINNLIENYITELAETGYEICKEHIENEDTTINKVRNKVGEVYSNVQNRFMEATTKETRRKIINGAALLGLASSFLISPYIFLGIFPIVRGFNTFTEEEGGYLFRNKFLDAVNSASGVGYAKLGIENLRERGVEISEKEEDKALESVSNYLTTGDVDLTFLKDGLKKRMREELPPLLKAKVVETIKPIARMLINEAAAVSKKVAEIAAENRIESELKRCIRPLAAGGILYAAGILSPFTLGLSALAPLAIKVGTAAYDAAWNYLNHYNEADQRERLTMLIENIIGNYTIDGLNKLFAAYNFTDEIQDSAFNIANMLAYPIAVNLVDHIMENKDDRFCKLLIESLEAQLTMQNRVIDVTNEQPQEQILSLEAESAMPKEDIVIEITENGEPLRKVL